MIKSIYFDLDGVLVDSKDVHYIALNKALETINKKYVISKEDHYNTFDGLPTMIKLEMLTKTRGLNQELYKYIWEMKQSYTKELVEEYTPNQEIVHVLKELKNLGYTLYVASNCIYSTLKTILLKKGYMPYIDYFISSEDVNHSKPSSEIYLKCLIRNGIVPKEALIIEDSQVGIEAATNSGCHVMIVKNSKEITLENILNKINGIKYKYPNLNIVIPCAGAGSRFNTGIPKPFIDVNGKPMIQKVVENLNLDANYIFIVQKQHNLKYFLKVLVPNCKVIEIDGLTRGAAETVLLAQRYIDNSNSLLIANCDQILEWNSNQFIKKIESSEHDGLISTFDIKVEGDVSKWSHVKLDNDSIVTEVSEKVPISDIATTGIYYWKHGCDFVKYARQMIEKDIQVNGEYYVCPVFNEAIQDGKKFITDKCYKMWGIGTPEDLELYLKF
jgi:HAD superfamily hydrolase (TIGR01509 family)